MAEILTRAEAFKISRFNAKLLKPHNENVFISDLSIKYHIIFSFELGSTLPP